MDPNDDDIISVTPEMKAAAGAELLAMIREGRWPADYDGDDQVILDDDLAPGAQGGGVTIRPATPADVPAMLGLIRDLATYEREPDAVQATEASLLTTLFGATPSAEAIVAETDGAVVGLALYFTNYSTWSGKTGLYLEDLYVTPAARGGGLGKALLARLAGLAVERGCARVEWSVLDWNAPAQAFYRALGARAMDEWTVHRLDGDALAALAGGG